MKRLFGGRGDSAELVAAELHAARTRAAALVEESRELVVVLDAERRVLAASRRARESVERLQVGERFPERLLEGRDGRDPHEVPYRVDGSTETLVYLGSPGDLAAYRELRTGFTAAVSHELRTPLARLMVLLDSLALPGSDAREVAARATAEVHQIGELIDDVLFLSELESGRAVVSLGSTPALPVLRDVIAARRERAELAGVELVLDCPPSMELPLRPRMLETVAGNLADNAIRYAGDGATFTLTVRGAPAETLLVASDTGAGVPAYDLPRLFERFFRSDRARSSQGTGLGLSIVKHIVTAAGGSVVAAETPGGGVEIRCAFPTGFR